MRKNPSISRRAVVAGLAVGPALPAATAATQTTSPDAGLIALARQLDAIPALLERTSDHDEAMALLDRMDDLSAAIVATPAETVKGLAAKARATVWTLQDEFDPMKESSINNRIAASIVHDLLNLRLPGA